MVNIVPLWFAVVTITKSRMSSHRIRFTPRFSSSRLLRVTQTPWYKHVDVQQTVYRFLVKILN